MKANDMLSNVLKGVAAEQEKINNQNFPQISSEKATATINKRGGIKEYVFDLENVAFDGVSGSGTPLSIKSRGAGLYLMQRGTSPGVCLKVTFGEANTSQFLVPGTKVRAPFDEATITIANGADFQLPAGSAFGPYAPLLPQVVNGKCRLLVLSEDDLFFEEAITEGRLLTGWDQYSKPVVNQNIVENNYFQNGISDDPVVGGRFGVPLTGVKGFRVCITIDPGQGGTDYITGGVAQFWYYTPYAKTGSWHKSEIQIPLPTGPGSFAVVLADQVCTVPHGHIFVELVGVTTQLLGSAFYVTIQTWGN